MAKHKGQKAKKQKGRGPGGTLSKKQKMQSNKARITTWLQNKVARGAKYEKLRAHGAAGNWKLFAHVLSNAWKKKGGTEQDTRFLQNSMNSRDVYWAVFGGPPRGEPGDPRPRPGDPRPVAATAPHARVDYLRMVDDLHAWLSARSGGEVNCADLDAFYAQFPHHDCRQGGGRGSGIKQAILRYGAQRLQWLDPEPSTGGEARIALPPPATVLRPGAEEGELDEALAAEFVPC